MTQTPDQQPKKRAKELPPERTHDQIQQYEQQVQQAITGVVKEKTK